MRFSFLVALHLAIGVQLMLPTVAMSAEVQETVRGVVARRSAIASGEFEYRFRAGFEHKNQVLIDQVERMRISGESWLVTYVFEKVTLTDLSHNGRCLTVQSQPARTSVGVQYTQERDLSSYRLPEYNGTMWAESTAEYIQEHVGACRVAGNEDVDGVATVALAWDVSKADVFKAFYAIDSELRDGGTLRICVAEKLGYVLPKIEYISPAGSVQKQYLARDFREVAPGLFYPWRCDMQTFKLGGVPGYYNSFVMKSVERVNQAFSDKDFEIELPAGTEVHDARQEQGAIAYRVTEKAPSEQLDELSAKIRPVEPSWRDWLHPWVAVALGVNVGLVAIVVAYLVRRRMRD